MKGSQENIELVDRYLQGELSREEALELGNFSHEEAFDQLVADFQTGMDDVMDEALSQDLKAIHSELFPEEAQKPGRYRWLRMAAAVLLVAVFGYLVLKPTQTEAPAFEAYFEVYPYYDLTRNTDRAAFDRAMESYAQAEYTKAWELLTVLSEGERPVEYTFYKGVCALALNKPKMAITNLTENLNLSENQYEQQARWYLALAYWQAGDILNAKLNLLSIPPNEHNYQLAKQLLDLL